MENVRRQQHVPGGAIEMRAERSLQWLAVKAIVSGEGKVMLIREVRILHGRFVNQGEDNNYTFLVLHDFHTTYFCPDAIPILCFRFNEVAFLIVKYRKVLLDQQQFANDGFTSPEHLQFFLSEFPNNKTHSEMLHFFKSWLIITGRIQMVTGKIMVSSATCRFFRGINLCLFDGECILTNNGFFIILGVTQIPYDN